MSRGITPRFTTWCPEPSTPLGRDNPEGAPLEYHVRLLEAYATRWSGTASSRRPATAPRARATRSSPSARSWTCSRRKRRRCRHEPRVASTRRARLWHEANDEELIERAQAVRAQLAPARSRDVHGHADHQLHERLCRAVRLLRLLRAPEPGRRLRPLPRGRVREDRRAGRGRRRPRRLQRRFQPEAAARLLLRPLPRRSASATASASSSTR